MPPKNIKTTYADIGGSTGGGGGGSSVLMYGSSGADVKRLQELLNSLGYNAGTADGIFGAQTQAAVTQMQKDAGITADGIVGSQTWNKISTATPVTNPPAVDVKAGAAGGEMGGIQKLPDAPTTTNTSFTAAPEPEGGSAKADNTPKPGTTPVGEMATFQKLPDAPQPEISVPDYTSTLASLGIINNAAQEKNQQYSGADIPTASPGELRAEAQAPFVTAKTEEALANKAAGNQNTVTPSPSTGYGNTVASLGTLPNAAQNKNQQSGVPKTEPPTYNPPSYNPPSSGASGTVQPYSGTGATGGAPTGGNNYNYTQNAQNGGGNVPAAPSGAENAGTVDPILESYTAALNALDSTGTGDAGSPKYDDDLWALYEKIVNREPFRYDINEDMLYRQYAQQYTDQGRLAMEDAMGRAAALTGGYGSTYAQSVGQQTYDSYLQRLNEVIPELYDRRYQAWQDEGTQLERQYSLLGDLKDREAAAEQEAYERWKDKQDYDLKLSEIEREQGNIDWEHSFSEQKFAFDQSAQAWNQWFNEQKFAADQSAQAWNQWFNEQELAADLDNEAWNRWYKEQVLAQDQANADRDYYLNLEKLYADIESDQNKKAVDIAEDPYQVIADTIAGLKQAGVRDGTEAYKVLLAQGMKDDQAKAYADMFASWSYDPTLEAARMNPQTADPTINTGRYPIGKNDKISFDYDPNEGIYTLNGNRFNSFDGFLRYLESVPMTDSQYNALVRSAKSYGIYLEGK